MSKLIRNVSIQQFINFHEILCLFENDYYNDKRIQSDRTFPVDFTPFQMQK